MFPQVGDSVKFTDSFFKNHSRYSSLYWVGPYHGIELEVLSVDLFTMAPQAIYHAYITVNGIMQRVSIDSSGLFVKDNGTVCHSLTVFESYYVGISISASTSAVPFSASKPVPVSTPAWVPGAPPQPKVALSEHDRCKKCGTMGDVSGMCCRCPNCGHTIWGV